jgi:gamma-glutamyltranspeptidase/glutathione hydrolase
VSTPPDGQAGPLRSEPAGGFGRGLVVCPQPLAAEAGAQLLRAGGNAVDAAVATAFAQMVVDPFNASPGGMGQALVWLTPEERERVAAADPPKISHICGLMADGPVELSFHTRAGRHARENMWADIVCGRTQFWGQIVLDGHPNDVGYGAIMVPGTIAGLWELHRTLARQPWQRCIAPAIELARAGVPVRTNIHRFWSVPREPTLLVQGAERLRRFPETAKHYVDATGSLPEVGDLLVNNDLAACLEAIAVGGGPAFYTGALAEAIAGDLEANGSTVAAEDLHEYEPYWERPLRTPYRDHDVYSIRPPGGGITIMQILSMLEVADARRLDPWSLRAAELYAYASRSAFRDRAASVGDPRFVEVPLDALLDREHAARTVEAFNAGLPIEVVDPASKALGDTTHVSVVDAGGSAVSLTHTIGSGSGVTTPNLGFMWNNCFYLADPRPGRPNSIAPGKARLTGMAPTMLFEAGRLSMVVGAPGGSGIISGIAQAIRNVVEYGMSAAEAVAFPRLHAEGDSIRVEGRFDRRLVHRFREQGVDVVYGPDGHDRGGVGFVEAIVIRRPQSGSPWQRRRLDPGADPRADGGLVWE